MATTRRARSPQIETGYALVRHEDDVGDDAWEDEIVDASLNRVAWFLGFSRIDGREYAVWRHSPMIIAQLAVGPRHPSQFRRR